MDTQERIIVWFSAVLVVIIITIGAYQVAVGPKKELPRKDGALSMPLDQTDHTKGPKAPKVTLVEYSDFQCPACANYYPMVEEVFSEYKDRISFTYRHFPLPARVHKNALVSAYASEAADMQGKFWEMTDMLFKNQSEWAESTYAQNIFEGYARKIGMNVAKFNIDIESDVVKARVERDRKSGELSNIDHTPTFFINGKMATNPKSKEELKALIEYAITHP